MFLPTFYFTLKKAIIYEGVTIILKFTTMNEIKTVK